MSSIRGGHWAAQPCQRAAGPSLNLDGTYVAIEDAVAGAVSGYLAPWALNQAVRLVRGQELLGYGAMKTLAAMGAWLGPVASLVVFVGALTLKHAGLVLYDKAAIFETTICPIGPQIALCAMFYLLWGRRCRSVDERMVVFRRASC